MRPGWSSSNCPDDPSYRDTWHGTLSGMAFLEGEMTISIQAEDTNANVLMDPQVGTEDPYIDIHHGFTLEQSGDNWIVTLSANCYGSPGRRVSLPGSRHHL